MSALLARALEAAGLDLLVLGALADRVRAAERGDVVRIHLAQPTTPARTLTGEAAGDGTAFLRRLAIARLAGERGAIRIDAESIGLPLAQVCLTFGADELVAPLRKLSLEVYGASDANTREKAVLRERELCALVRAAGRTPRVVDEQGTERDPDETTPATRKFRAPGREAADLARAFETHDRDRERDAE